MLRIYSLALLVCLSLSAFARTQAQAEESISLFNGKNLDGWTYALDKPGLAMEKVWSVDPGEGDEAGVLKCKGRPSGYLRTKKDYENYKLTLQWRWPDKDKPGNNGVLVHASSPKELGIWPKSLEVQLKNENAGDFWVIGTEIDVPNEAKRVEGRRHVNLTDGTEKPLGEWNTMEIVCDGASVTVRINGELVNQGINSTVTKGAICLQSEGAPIEYREIKLMPLKRVK